MAKGTIAVVSHKGGVGKTLIAVNLALTLSERGFKIAIVDADLSSPNLAQDFLGIEKDMETSTEKLHPVDYKGIKVFSMGLLAREKTVSMDGSQYASLLSDAIQFSEWGDIDYFVVDSPPGSSDIFKTVTRVFADTYLGSIIVSQPSHTLDARRAITLHKNLEIPIIGIIENMSYLMVGRGKWEIFGKSMVKKLGEEFGVDVLGVIPLSYKIRKNLNVGNPKLPEKLAEPIVKAVNKIITLKPQKPGFLARIKAKAREFIEALLVEMVVTINKEIDIKGLREQYGYPGGRVIRFNLMSEEMDRILVQADFKIHNGKLLAVENPAVAHTVIDITPKAFAWSVMGDKVMPDGTVYDLETAWYLGEARVFGRGECIRGIHFFKHVWGELRRNQSAINKLRPLLERLA